jgi:hypothetical protein
LTTLKEFEDALKEQGMLMALAILQRLKDRDRTSRSRNPGRRISGQKMTPELARRILELHSSTGKTQQEIAFELGVNQGRVNEVIKRGKWLSDDPNAPEAIARDKGKVRIEKARKASSAGQPAPDVIAREEKPQTKRKTRPRDSAQLSIEDFLNRSS